MIDATMIGTIATMIAAVVYAVARRPLVASMRARLDHSEAERDRVVSVMREEILALQGEIHRLRQLLAKNGIQESDNDHRPGI